MSEQNLDTTGWDDIADSRPTIPDGEYTIKLVEPNVRQKQGGTSYFMTFNSIVQVGPHAGYVVYNGLWSLKPDQLWRFKRDMKTLGLEVEGGLSAKEAAESFAEQLDGLDVIAQVGSRIRQVKDDDGNYVTDPEGSRENTIRRIVGPAL